MMPPDFAGGNCQSLDPEVLEGTFWYPGPQDLARTPGDAALAAWEQAKEICIECPIFLMCRENSWGQEFGVVGGTDQHERHLHRRRLTRLLALKNEADRAAMAAFFHARHAGGLGDSPDVIARSTGYSSLMVKLMLSEHDDLLNGQRERRSEAAIGPALERWEDVPKFPKASPPKADGWCWYFGRAYAGHYVAHTDDGAYLLMKIKPARAQTTKWLPVGHVDLRSTITPVVQDWINRPNGAKTHCPEDHEYDEKNTYVNPAGFRICRTCKNENRRVNGVQAEIEDDQRSGIEAAPAA